MSYQIVFTSSAEREFLGLPKIERQRIGSRIETLAQTPRPAGCVKLSGATSLWPYPLR